MDHYIIVDCGTGSGRTIIFNELGEEIAISQKEWVHKNFTGVPGAIDFDTKNNWTELKKIIKDALDKSGIDRNTVKAISASSMREGMVLYDYNGREIWACSNIDARAGKEAEDLIKKGIQLKLYNITGQTFSLSDAPRLLWVKRNLPDIYEKAAKLGMLSDWVIYKLSGVFSVEPSNVSTSGLFDTFKRRWNSEVFSDLDLKENMCPDVYEPGDFSGNILPELAEEFCIPKDTAVIVGGGDVQIGTIGVGSVNEGDTCIFGGTFWQSEVNVKNPVPDEKAKVRINAHAIKNLFQYEGIAFQVGQVMKWFRDSFCTEEKRIANQLSISSFSLLSEMTKKVPAGSYGLIPIFSDIMNYQHWKHAAPAFINFDINSPEKFGKPTFYKALMENACFATKGNLEIISETSGHHPQRATFAGGGSYSPEWAKILSNILGIPIDIPKVKEATSLGNLIVCLVATGKFSDFNEAVDAIYKREMTCYPDMRTHNKYEEYYEKWKEVYRDALKITDDKKLNHMWKAPGE